MLIFAFAKQNFTYKRNDAIILDTASVRDGERVRIPVRCDNARMTTRI